MIFTSTSFDIEPLVHGSMKKKLPELELAIDGYITPEQAVLFARSQGYRIKTAS